MPAPDKIPFGAKVARLTLIKELPKQNTKRVIECLCDCGATTAVLWQNIKQRKTTSCGCYAIEVNTTHGDSRTALYNSWHNMMLRCYHSSRRDYPYYGGKGIKVCQDWHDYPKFKQWALSSGHADNLTIERKDTAKNYEPVNCIWVDRSHQAANRSKRSNTSAPYIGVGAWGTKWYARITQNNQRIYFSVHDTPEEARDARDAFIKLNGLPHRIND